MSNNNEEVYIKIILTFINMIFYSNNELSILSIDSMLKNEMSKAKIPGISDEDIKIVIKKLLKYKKDRSLKPLTANDIVDFIKICLTKYNLMGCLDSPLLGDTLSSLIEMEFNQQVPVGDIEILMEEYIDGYIEKQLARRRARKEFYKTTTQETKLD